MPKQPLTLALPAAAAVTAGLALGFFELTIAGAIAALVAVVLWLRAARRSHGLGGLQRSTPRKRPSPPGARARRNDVVEEPGGGGSSGSSS